MITKPTYEELQQRVKELENELLEQKQAEGILIRQEQEKGMMLESLVEHVVYQDLDNTVVWANRAACESVGKTRESLIGRHCYEIWAERRSPCEECPVKRSVETGSPQAMEKTTPDERCWYIQGCPVRDEDGKIVGAVELTLDITERKKAEEALKEKEAQLKAKADSLEEVNTALRVLLKRRDNDKEELEAKVLSNVKDLILPYIERLKKSPLKDDQKSCVDILESNLTDIVSPFSRRLSSKYLGLTPTEIRVANLIKEDKTTKEIAEFMRLSKKTVETHRDHIRRKLGIKHKKVNLKTYLLSLQ
jgi:PAS domain S-box-containing protein